MLYNFGSHSWRSAICNKFYQFTDRFLQHQKCNGIDHQKVNQIKISIYLRGAKQLRKTGEIFVWSWDMDDEERRRKLWIWRRIEDKNKEILRRNEKREDW